MKTTDIQLSSIPYHAEVKGVECLWTIQRDDPDIVVGAEEDVITGVRRVISLGHFGYGAQRQSRP